MALNMPLIERILLVESDPDISDLIARQALKPLGYQVDIVTDAGSAIKKALQTPPDLVIANLNLPGLSGKDLLVALSSQGMHAPLLIVAAKGQEQDVIQAFRLGATDVLLWPARDAEVVSAVERVLTQVRETYARRHLDEQLKEVNENLQHKVGELTSMIAIGKAVVSITDRRVLFERIVEGALHVSGADLGWLLLRDDHSKNYILTAHKNLPEAWAKKMGQTLDDGVSSLVALSGESLLIHGAPLQKFKVAALGGSVAVTPIKVHNEVIGLMIVVRKTQKPFGETEQTLLEAVADYASISLVNERLFRAIQQNAEAARAGEKRQNDLFQSLRLAVQKDLDGILYPLGLILTGKTGPLNAEQRQALSSANAAAQRLSELVVHETPDG
ncbi:MAG: response regulator [Anaerolineaceae bacterium]|nr:MAG: response regulator [Anaerolineaceae bacterium]